MKLKVLLGITLGMLVLISSCKKEKEAPQIPNEEEVITTLTLTMVPTGGGNPVVFSFKDLDGDGGNPPVIVNANLKANTGYSGTIVLLNELANPTENITEEVEEEGDVHQFFYPNDVDGLAIHYMDQDTGGHPIGIQIHVVTGAEGNGTLTVVLRHQPDKTAAGVSHGELANAGGETDIQVTFNLNVE
jgi:hypothetical protein